MDDLWLRLLLALLLSFFVCCTSLECPRGKPLPPDSCVQVFSTNSSQSTVCGDLADGPVRFTEPSQFHILSRYAQVVGTMGRFYWLGYQFTSAGNLSDVDADIAHVLLDGSNYGNQELQEPAGEGVCLAMGQDGLLYRMMCETQLPGLCYERFERPNATLSIRNNSRFVMVEAGVQLDCEASERSNVTWRASRAGASEPVVIKPPNITSFSVDDAGTYYCVASNPLGAFVSNPVVLVVNHTNVDRDPTAPEVMAITSSQPAAAQFGSNLTLTCDFTSDLIVTNTNWFVNGRPMRETSGVDQMSTSLRVVNLQEEGFYQCFIRTENGNVGSASMLIQAQSGVPSKVDEISALPSTQTSIIVTWLCPLFPNTIDVALLRYRVFYQQGFQVSTTSGEASSMDNVLPTLVTGEESSDCLVEAVVPNLMMGTTYAVKVVAVSLGGTMGEVADAFAVTTTFGQVPGLVEGLKVQRTEDNKTVHAMWEDLKTTLPVGVVSRYWIEYRDSEKNSVSTVFHQAKFNFLVVTNVINANTYEVRVSAGTVVRRKPLEFEYGAFTNWTEVRGISNNVPPATAAMEALIGATVGPLGTEPAVGALAAGITVGVLSFIVTMAILIAGLVCYIYKRGSTRSYSVKYVKNGNKETDEETDKEAEAELSEQ